jgi:hypothetical protein
MESAAVAQAAAEAGVPCIAVRVIADSSADALPENVLSLVTADGRTRYRGLLPVLLAPSQIPLLLSLARRSSAACRVLSTLAGYCAARAN